MAEINKKILKHLAELSRIEIDPKKEDKFLIDFKSILGHFDELANLDTSGVVPMVRNYRLFFYAHQFIFSGCRRNYRGFGGDYDYYDYR